MPTLGHDRGKLSTPENMAKAKKSKHTTGQPQGLASAPCSPAVLTVDVLKTLKFGLHLHITGGDEYSKIVETNDEWGIAVSTETNGSPDYLITSKEIYMMANHDVVMDMRKKPWDLEGFVAAYNASRANAERSHGANNG